MLGHASCLGSPKVTATPWKIPGRDTAGFAPFVLPWQPQASHRFQTGYLKYDGACEGHQYLQQPHSADFPDIFSMPRFKQKVVTDSVLKLTAKGLWRKEKKNIIKFYSSEVAACFSLPFSRGKLSFTQNKRGSNS